VVLTGDSIAGIPFLQPLDCDSCRVTLPVSAVDSLRTGDPEGGFWATAALGMFGLIVGIFLGCAAGLEGCAWGGT
jgi:hypothetical protein